MTITDGRRVRHELGPRLVWEFSNMRMVAATGTTGEGGWSRKMMTVMTERAPREPYLAPLVTLDEPCPECGGAIVVRNHTIAIYCSPRCRNRVNKRRQRGKEKA